MCELFWEIPDDPRGSLRWSLSKLRRLVDDDTCQRIVADRINVKFVASIDVAIDVTALRALAGGDLEHCPLERLEDAAARYAGNFLEGLALPNFHDFDAWCTAEREFATQRKSALAALVRRLADDPERALSHARALVHIAPYDETRATLIRLLVALGRSDLASSNTKSAHGC